MGNLGLDTRELLPLRSQDTEFKGFKSLCTSGFILCPVPAELPYVTVMVPGFAGISLVSTQGKPNHHLAGRPTPHGEISAYLLLLLLPRGLILFLNTSPKINIWRLLHLAEIRQIVLRGHSG